jgi:UDP-2,4-diacetamido-2,4,6-trideoxy-beta-L-altropyranose hydrolase
MPRQLEGRITKAGHGLTYLEPAGPAAATPEANRPPHAAWLPVSQHEDATQTRAALTAEGATGPDWLVVDHYALDARWERAIAGPETRIMAIDDLADRPHAARLLLDQTLGRVASDYAGLAPDAEVLAGTRYALLRPEFAALRAASLARRRRITRPNRILISMGGLDAGGLTARILEALVERPDLYVTAVMGGEAPSLEAVRAHISARGEMGTLLVDTPDMAEAMAEADLAIGASGTTSWERCVLGLPTLVVVLAENQIASAQALATAGAIAVLPEPISVPDWKKALLDQLSRLADPERLAITSQAAAAACDGRGTDRVVRQILASTPDLRSAAPGDSRAIWEWRHADGADRFYPAGATPFPAHNAWFTKALEDPNRTLLVAECNGALAGHLRLDHDGDGTTVSIVMAPAQRGRGLGRAVLEAGLRRASSGAVRALVHVENTASMRLFAKAGFRRAGKAESFVTYIRDAEPHPEDTP